MMKKALENCKSTPFGAATGNAPRFFTNAAAPAALGRPTSWASLAPNLAALLALALAVTGLVRGLQGRNAMDVM
jgi:hypothetical protein